MRLPVRASLVLLAGLASAASGLWSSGAQAQEVAFAERGPRFLQVRHTNQPPVEIDASSSGAMRLLVSVDLDEPTVGRVLAAIERQTGLRFVYSRALVSPERPVTLRAASISVAAALTEVLLDANVDVLLSNGPQVVLVARPPEGVRDSGAVRGRVTDNKTGAPLPGATITIVGTGLTATTTRDGNYRIADVAVGTYQVSARAIGYRPVAGSVVIVAGAETTVDLALGKSVQRLDEVVVTGTVVPTEVKALPTPVTTISAEEIKETNPRTINEIVRRFVPGAVAWDLPANPNQTPLSVRGASTLSPGSGSIKVLIDGVEVADRSSAAIDPATIERIEVVRGPQAGAIYGSDAIAGVVQIFTKRGDLDSPPRLEGEATLGVVQSPYADYSGALKQVYRAELRGGTRDVSYNVGAGYSRTGEWTPEGEASYPSANLGVRLNQSALVVDVFGRYYAQSTQQVLAPELDETGFAAARGPFHTPARYEEQTGGVKAVLSATPSWTHTVTAGADRLALDLHQTQPRRTTPSDTLLTVAERNRSRYWFGYNTSVRFGLGPQLQSTVTAGIDTYVLRSNSFSATGVNSDGTIRTPSNRPPTTSRSVANNTGYFAQVQAGFYDRLFVTVGVRAEDNSTFGADLGTPVKPRVGGSFVQALGATTVKLRASYGESIRPPEPGQRDQILTTTSTQLANDDLGPEQQFGWDAGVDADFGDRGSLGFTYYRQVGKDFIQSVLLSASPRTTQQQNVGRLRNSGIEVEGRLRVASANVRVTYAYAKSTITDLGTRYTGDLRVGDQAFLTPTHTAGATVSGSPVPGLDLSVGVTYVSDWTYYDVIAQFSCFGGTAPCRPTNRDYLKTYPGFTKFSLYAAFPVWLGLDAFLGVDNLTNEQVFELSNSAPRIGRITSVGLRVTSLALQ